VIPALPAGIPTITAYEHLLASPDFRRLESFSNAFLTRHESALRPYSRRWVADPLHQWSRQWEYPFVLSRISPASPGRRPATVLDAGSGVTFLPWLMADLLEPVTVYCCDGDASLAPIFGAVNAARKAEVQFTAADLHDLPYPAGSFDAACCVSVLEHVDRRAEVVEELFRVLRPGGRLVLTFDLTQDSGEDDEFEAMLVALRSGFAADAADPDCIDPRPSRSAPDVLSTSYAAAVDRDLLPWKHPLLYRLSCLVSGHGWVPWPPPLTVACLSLTRRA
jgi:SAM-dependent methyltransferase